MRRLLHKSPEAFTLTTLDITKNRHRADAEAQKLTVSVRTNVNSTYTKVGDAEGERSQPIPNLTQLFGTRIPMVPRSHKVGPHCHKSKRDSGSSAGKVRTTAWITSSTRRTTVTGRSLQPQHDIVCRLPSPTKQHKRTLARTATTGQSAHQSAVHEWSRTDSDAGTSTAQRKQGITSSLVVAMAHDVMNSYPITSVS